jgi:hypothetical protein
MKSYRSVFLLSLFVAGLLLMQMSSCKRNDDDQRPPVVSTLPINSITGSTAQSGGVITDEDGVFVSARGVCWSKSPSPTIGSSKTVEGTGTGEFTSILSGLDPDATYYVRAYGTNFAGTGYGNEVTFTTANTLETPCSPPANSAVYNLQVQYYTSYAGYGGGLVYGNYGLVGYGSSSDIRIEFIEAPISGKYITTGATSFIGTRECVVDGTFGTMLGYHYVAAAGDTVYVIKTGTDKYTMTFCDLHFNSGSTSFDFYSDGNLTVH